MIRLRTLGSVDLRAADGTAVDAVLMQPRRLALLIYLAAARPTGFHRRDRLVALFWPELDDAAARDGLSGALRFLRKVLGPDVLTMRGIDEVGVDATRLWCDAVALRTALDSAHAEAALELYQGDFLDGFFADEAPGFEEWAESERSMLRGLAAQGARVLAEQSSERGLHTAAVTWGRRAVDLARNDERAFRRLLGFLERAGDYAGALEAYEIFVGRLRTEFGAGPAPETQRLIAVIRDASQSVVAVATPDSAIRLPLEPASDPSDHTEARQETFAVGSTIANGAYRIDGILNASASSTRYVAIDVRHGRAVTVTALRPAVAAGATALLQQIRIAAGLQHPHIVPVFDSGEADGRVFYVTPRVAGDSLRVFLKRNPFIRLRSVLRTARDVADALASAHMHGVVHGAVSPESVFMTGDPVTDDLHAMVADFGVATALDAARRERSAPDSADTRGPADTNAYLAPELLEGSAVSIRADVFAWGAITRELLWCHHASNNRQPANGATPGASTPLDSSVPSSIAELVRQCLHRDPEARPADAKELLSRFDHAVSLTRRISPPTPGILARLTRFAGSAHHGHPAHASVFTRKRRVAEALIVVLALLLSRRAAPAERVQTVSVVVAASDIVDGVRLDQSTMAIAHWPRQAKPFAAFASLDSVLGRVTSLPVAKGEAIVPDRLVTPGAGTPDSKIDAGKRAHPVLISDPGASVGRIPPYGRVDVMSVRRGVDARRVMTVVFSDIRLLEIKGVSRRRGTDGTFTATAVARLELSPAEIARLRGAAAQGEIRLSPREQTDSTRRAPGKEP